MPPVWWPEKVSKDFNPRGKKMIKQIISKARGFGYAAVMALGMCLCQGAFPASSMESYISEIDGSSQSFGLYIPEPFDPNVPHPVVFDMHGGGEWADAVFPMSPYADANGWILVDAGGRDPYSLYLGVAQDDILYVLDELRRRYPSGIDENRIYIEGCSMGGMGASRLGFLYPHRFASAVSVDGWSNLHGFVRQWFAPAGSPDEVDARRAPLIEALSALYVAENGKHLNLYLGVDTSDGNVPPSQTYDLHDRLDELGYSHSYNQFPGGGHCAGWNLSAIYDFFALQTNDPTPQDVVLKANQLKYGSAYWLRIDRLEKSMVFATIEATVSGKNKDRVEVTATGVLQYTLFLTPELVEVGEVNVLTNSELVYTGPPEEITVSASLDSSGNITGWSMNDTLPRGLRKTAQIEGAIGHAYQSKFFLVTGTTSKADTPGNRQEAEQFASDWNLRNHANISPVDDTSITDDDVAASNLILFGTADSNSIIAAINDLLPIRIWRDRIVAGANEYLGDNYGLYMVFPNPLNSQRYVVISHGAIPGWCHPTDIIALALLWPDYVVFDMNTALRAAISASPYGEPMFYHPDAWVEAGYFDQYWRLDNDEDGMDDIFEKDIIDARDDDPIETIEDVNTKDDFDGDGHNNRTEYNAGTNGTDPESFFSILSANPDPTDAASFQVCWKVATRRSYYILWSDSMGGPWHEIEKLNPDDVSDVGDPMMGGKKPGDCTGRFYKVAAYR
jgi:pimeloyl-ACP methyl ester carboxylesterase